ncbi:hypothetical protein FNE60_29960, partial [Klebsiella pneumoniae]
NVRDNKFLNFISLQKRNISLLKMSLSRCRQNFHEESEAAINKQINMELYASYVYLAMYAYFDRDDVALPGFAKYFKEMSQEEREHAEKFVQYQNKRGGRVVYQPIEKPVKQEWGSGLEAMEDALQMEKDVNESLLKLHGIATAHADPHLTNYLEEEFLEEQVESIYKFSQHITKLRRVGDGLGVYIFDKDLS